MSIFTGDGQMSEKVPDCKRNIEDEIKRIRQRSLKEQKLLTALYEYMSDGYYDARYEFTLPSLIGSLHLVIESSKRNIDRLIKEQEDQKRASYTTTNQTPAGRPGKNRK